MAGTSLIEKLSAKEAENTELSAKNKELETKLAEVTAQAAQASPSGLDVKDVEMLKAITMAENGLTHAELLVSMQEPAAIIAYRLKKLDTQHLIAAHGGGLQPMRYKTDDAGAAYLINNKLI